MDADRSDKSPRRRARPLDDTALEELALAYAARYATSAARLARYLRRKLRERGWEGEGEPDIDALVARFEERRFVDDDAFADARARNLLRRGYGPRRIDQALFDAGIAEPRRDEARPGDREAREAAIALARKRRFGPFGAGYDGGEDAHKLREKHLAAMIRAGHGFDTARGVLDAADENALADWLAQ